MDEKERRDGDGRRKEDHELLLEIHLNLNNFLDNYSEHRKDFKDHVAEDKHNFSIVNQRQSDLAKYIWMGVGILGTIEFVLIKIFK